jgi:hypothetical protein
VRTSWLAWARTHKLLAILVPVLVIVLAAGAAIASTSGGSTASGQGGAGANSGTVDIGSASSSPAPTTSGSSHKAGTADAGKPVTVATQPATTSGEKWVTGPASRLLGAVNTDVGKISADLQAGKDSAAQKLGALLTADAKAALDGPMPPVDSTVYRAALEDFEQVGTDTTSGDFSKTSPLLTTANVDVMSVTAAANLSAPANPPAQDNDPNDG